MVKKSSEDPESRNHNLSMIIEEQASTQKTLNESIELLCAQTSRATIAEEQNQQLTEKIDELNKQLEEAASK